MEEGQLNIVKLEHLSNEAFRIALEHGWHDELLSEKHYLGLVMTEVAEAIEADRHGKRADTDTMAHIMKTQAEGGIGLTNGWYETWYGMYYNEYVKGSIEEEFADIVIRLLDMAICVHGDKMKWLGNYPCGSVYSEKNSFIENAWFFVHDVLNWGTMDISDCVSFMLDWAQDLGIDLWQHIEWKKKFNELRPYKHGGKKY